MIEFLKTNPYDLSSKDIVYIYENAQDYKQKELIDKLVKSYIEVEMDYESIEIFDGDNWDYEIGRIFSTRLKKYDIPEMTKGKLRQARIRLEEKIKSDKIKESENKVREIDQKFDELF